MNGYVTAWIVILVMAAGGSAALYYLTRSMKPSMWLLLLRVLPGVLLIVPAPVPGYPNVAPAFVVLVFESLFQAEGRPLPAVIILSAAVVVAVLAVVLGWRMSNTRHTAEGAANAS
jgi:hypothetical protein